MKLLRFITKPLGLKNKTETIIGCIFSILFLSSFSWLIFLVSEQIKISNLIAIAALLVLFLFFKLYRPVCYNTIATLIISVYTGIVSAIRFRPKNYLFEEHATLYMILTWIAFFMIFSGLVAYVLGVLIKQFGNEFNPKLYSKSLLICTAVFFTVFLFLTSETYFYNYTELKYTYIDFAPFFLLKTIFYSILIAFCLCMFNEKGFRFISNILVGILLCIYVQYMFMNTKLLKAGEAVKWNELHKEMIINGIIWIIILSLPFIFDHFTNKKKTDDDKIHISKLNIAVPSFISGIQLITLIVLMISNSSAISEYEVLNLSGKDQFYVSKKNNIITFILDMADQNYFEPIYKQSPERFSFMKDFTYYTNTSMLYDSTYLSIPSTLAASKIYPETEIYDWYDQICNDEPAQTFYNRLHDNHYSVHVYGDFMNDYSAFYGKIDNVINVTKSDLIIDKEVLYNNIDAMSVYRLLPLCLKQFIEPTINFGNEAVTIPNSSATANQDFFNKIDLKLDDSDNNLFILQHIDGTHATINISEPYVYESLDILEKYFEQLKELGVYENSLIIVTADHGKHCAFDNMPIWYMKRPNETNDCLKFCNKPISLTDYAATCLDEMGLYMESDESILGRPISAIDENEERTRLVFQRPEFQYKKDKNQKNNILNTESCDYWPGYFYTGTKKDLVEHEKNDPPDILIASGFGG